nr:hypothetical protein [Xanthomonas phaseoli]
MAAGQGRDNPPADPRSAPDPARARRRPGRSGQRENGKRHRQKRRPVPQLPGLSQTCKKIPIGGKIDGRFLALDTIEQRPRRFRNILHRITGLGEIAQHFEHALRHIETNGITGAPRRGTGIIRHQNDDAAIPRWRRFQSQKGRDAVRHLLDTIRLRHIHKTDTAICPRLFERNRPGENPPVQFRQDDMHGTPRRSNNVSPLSSVWLAKAVAAMMAAGWRAGSTVSENGSLPHPSTR